MTTWRVSSFTNGADGKRGLYAQPLFDQSERMRKAAERRVRELSSVLQHVASRLAPEEVDRLRRENPNSLAYMTPEEWRRLFNRLLDARHPVNGWGDARQPRDDAEAARLRQEVQRLENALAAAEQSARQASIEVLRLRGELSALRQARRSEARTSEVRATEVRGESAGGEKTGVSERRPGDQPTTRAGDQRTQRLPDQQTKRPRDGQDYATALAMSIPDKPPIHGKLFLQWEREGKFLAILAATGWSMERGVREAFVEVEPSINQPESGSIKRMIKRMIKAKLIHRTVLHVSGNRRAAMIWLAPLGREVCQAMNIAPVESEWERLMRLHGGEAQEKHAAQVCVFTYHARRRGYQTEVCPEVDGPADPDALLVLDDERIYVEVESGSGSAGRRMKKWRNQAALQGFAALCADAPETRIMLLDEAKRVAKRGMATDLTQLEADPEQFWIQTWGDP